MEYGAVCCTDRGVKKKVNQDSACVMIADTMEGQVCMALLCDGMGGFSFGECASFSVVDCFADWFEHKLPYRIRDKRSLEVIGNEWQTILTELDDRMRKYGSAMQTRLGTTATCMLFWRKKYLLVQSGDSRAYHIGRSLTQLSEDQSFVQEQVNSGFMTQQEAKYHPKRNVLTDCIGGSRPSIPVCSVGRQKVPGSYLLCSDGFVHELSEKEIWENIRDSHEMEPGQVKERTEKLIREVIERGEKDNITAVVITVNKEVKQKKPGKISAEEFTVREKLIATEGSSLGKEELPATETEE